MKLTPRHLTFLALLLTPVVLLAYHYGPGQRGLQRDTAAQALRDADRAVAEERWTDAVAAFGRALAALPETDRDTRARIELRHADARAYAGDLPEVILQLEQLLAELQRDGVLPDRQRETREALAEANYYAAWLMRLEGAPEEEWLIPADDARQHLRHLAEGAAAQSSPRQRTHLENLEAAVRLTRMDLAELRAKPLPKKCGSCKNVSQKCRAQRDGLCRGKGGEEQPRDKIAKDKSQGAGSGGRPPGSGS